MNLTIRAATVGNGYVVEGPGVRAYCFTFWGARWYVWWTTHKPWGTEEQRLMRRTLKAEAWNEKQAKK